jgi:hypothetical protein
MSCGDAGTAVHLYWTCNYKAGQGSGIFERGFVAIDEGKITDLGKDFDCVGLIGYANNKM